MNRPKLFYISINDGSDTRINKEIQTLSGTFDIYYIGIGKSTEKSFVRQVCKSFQLIRGSHKSMLSLLKFYILFLATFFRYRFHSIHIINEQLLLMFYPFLLISRNKVVLDIFDSIFLRSGLQMSLLKNIVYRLPSLILVTDDNRKSLMPAVFGNKIVVLENYPYKYREANLKTRAQDKLVIFYNGSMSKARGTEMLQKMLQLSANIEIRMAGWIYDEATRELSQHPQVNFMGVITQQESMQVASHCDYILSLYEPKNENNINASPNKIYDAIQAQTPVIINAEVKIAQFVRTHAIGYILPSFYQIDYARTLQDLFTLRGNFTFSSSLQHQYTWEAIENKLLQAHTR